MPEIVVVTVGGGAEVWQLMKWHWLIWALASVALCLYVAAGYIASYTYILPIKLDAGFSTSVNVFRLAEDDYLRMRLQFQVIPEIHEDHTKRVELGDWHSSTDREKTGRLKFSRPGAAIRLTASLENTDPVSYEAMPMSGYNSTMVMRDLTSNPSIAPGEWAWPPVGKVQPLHIGYNHIKLEVVGVDPPLRGEEVKLYIDPALGFKSAKPNVIWLWWWFAWPIIAGIQFIWAMALAVRTWRGPREQRPPYMPTRQPDGTYR